MPRVSLSRRTIETREAATRYHLGMVSTAAAMPISDALENAPLPRYPELVRLSLRIDRLSSTENEAHARLGRAIPRFREGPDR